MAGIAVRGLGPAEFRTFKGELAGLYATANLATSQWLVPSKRTRFYLCRCSWYDETNEHALNEKDSEWAISVASKWECSGHPIVALPHDFDGVTVSAANLSEIVSRVLHGWTPPGAHAEDKPQWLARLHARLAGSSHADAVAAAVRSMTNDPDEKVRARAQQFVAARRA